MKLRYKYLQIFIQKFLGQDPREPEFNLDVLNFMNISQVYSNSGRWKVLKFWMICTVFAVWNKLFWHWLFPRLH